MNRRGFLFGGAGLLVAAAPAIVRASSLMAISPVPDWLVVETLKYYVVFTFKNGDKGAFPIEKGPLIGQLAKFTDPDMIAAVRIVPS